MALVKEWSLLVVKENETIISCDTCLAYKFESVLSARYVSGGVGKLICLHNYHALRALLILSATYQVDELALINRTREREVGRVMTRNKRSYRAVISPPFLRLDYLPCHEDPEHE